MRKSVLRKFLLVFTLLALALSACTAPATPALPAEAKEPVAAEPVEEATEGKTLILATTTSTQDSGLLDYLLPLYTEATGVKVNVLAVGTGEALKLGEDGNADVLLVHARAKEDAFMEAKHGVRREDVMYNDFIIIGPESDPAGIKDLSAVDAFKKIAESKSKFVSRGDDSGTHTKEKSIWAKAEIEPAGDWYISAGDSMGAVLTMSNEQGAYTLSDRATYLSRAKQGLSLVILSEGDTSLLNSYGVIAVNPEKGPQIQNDLANQFIDWIISVPTQEKIAEFGKVEFGNSLFFPDSQAWKDARPK